ncbi:cerberus [Anomaloglossus baeobatrachus]|uniref:cerberus n=1 Tax=Anomaloglossus baeobatrachus TaxID=238106 RepID=UPI003F50BEDB
MLLQILQFLLVFYFASHGEGKAVETRGKSKHYSIIHQHHLKKEMDSNSSFWGPDRNIGKEETISGISNINPDLTGVLKSKPQMKDRHKDKSTQATGLPRMVGYGELRKKQVSERKLEEDEKKYAQASWNQFIYGLNAASEGLNYSVKTDEVQREVCKTLPFTQNIIHENCDKVFIKNNLCFGQCNSLYVPNQREQLNICFRCLPFKFTMNHMKMNCTGYSNVVKVVIMVQECGCVGYSHNSHGRNIIKDSNLYGHH